MDSLRYARETIFAQRHREIVFCIAALAVGLYLLAPRFWEPGAESWKNWESARILHETGGFGVLHHGALYSLYLQFWLLFEYPVSMVTEHIVTRFFLVTCVFLLIRRFLPSSLALALTFAWIPSLWIVEAGTRAVGIGCVSLYFSRERDSVWNRGIVPLSLGAGALCDTSCIPFLIGHAIVAGYECFVARRVSPRLGAIGPLKVAKCGLLILALAAVLLQSERTDNTVHGFVYPWVPVPQKEIFSVAVFSYANWKYVEANFPRDQWFQHDWYHTHEQIFGDATTLLGAVLNNPGHMLKLVAINALGLTRMPLNLIAGFGLIGYQSLATLVSCMLMSLLLPFGAYRAVLSYKSSAPQIAALCLGTFATIGAFLLVTTESFRFTMVLLPVALLAVSHFGRGLSFAGGLANDWRTILSARSATTVKRTQRTLMVCGISLIVIGVAANECVLLPVLSLDGGASAWTRVAIAFVECVLVAVGLSLVFRHLTWVTLFRRIKAQTSDNRQSLFPAVVTLMIALLVFSTAVRAKIEDPSLSDHLGYEYLLSGSRPVSMSIASRELVEGLDDQTRVLGLEAPWLRTFGPTGLDNVFHPLLLPPFEDTTGETERFLETLDVIWVSKNWSKKVPSLATQVYLRYSLHVAPFLEKAVQRGWAAQEIPHFGVVFRKSST